MTRDELLADLERCAADAEAIGSTAPVSQVLRHVRAKVAQLETAAPCPARGPDRLLVLQVAAERLGVSLRWFYDNRHKLPFIMKISHRQLRVSERKLERWMAQREVT